MSNDWTKLTLDWDSSQELYVTLPRYSVSSIHMPRFSKLNFSKFWKYFFTKIKSKKPSAKTPNPEGFLLTRSELRERSFWKVCLHLLQGVLAKMEGGSTLLDLRLLGVQFLWILTNLGLPRKTIRFRIANVSDVMSTIPRGRRVRFYFPKLYRQIAVLKGVVLRK